MMGKLKVGSGRALLEPLGWNHSAQISSAGSGMRCIHHLRRDQDLTLGNTTRSLRTCAVEGMTSERNRRSSMRNVHGRV